VSALFLIVAMVVLMWLLLIRPQRKRQMEQKAMLSNVEIGDEIVTTGGLYGIVRSIDDDELGVEIAPGTTVRIARRAVAGVFEEDDEAEAEEDAAEGETTPAEEDGPEAESDSSSALHR
jgi:preprotein translocase subunit YajC